MKATKGKPQPDTSPRDTENGTWRCTSGGRCCHTSPDAWIDQERTKAGCETPFNRHLYVYRPPRDLAEIGVVTEKRSRLSTLRPVPGYLAVEAEELLGLDWSEEWRG